MSTAVVISCARWGLLLRVLGTCGCASLGSRGKPGGLHASERIARGGVALRSLLLRLIISVLRRHLLALLVAAVVWLLSGLGTPTELGLRLPVAIVVLGVVVAVLVATSVLGVVFFATGWPTAAVLLLVGGVLSTVVMFVVAGLLLTLLCSTTILAASIARGGVVVVSLRAGALALTIVVLVAVVGSSFLHC